MNLLKQVRAFSRGRDAARLFTNGLHGEEEMGTIELLYLLSLLAMRHSVGEVTDGANTLVR